MKMGNGLLTAYLNWITCWFSIIDHLAL